MNKFKFIEDECPLQKAFREVFFYKEYEKDFNFVFCCYVPDNVIDMTSSIDRDAYRRTGPIVKSEIKESVKKQLKMMFEDIKKSNKELLFLKMSKKTRDAFRIYFSYEVSYVQKTLKEDLYMGKAIGCVYGVKIIEDTSLSFGVVRPIIKINNQKHKFQSIF